jgi:hypothetical protein
LQVQHFCKADLAYGGGVAKGLGLDIVSERTTAGAAD